MIELVIADGWPNRRRDVDFRYRIRGAATGALLFRSRSNFPVYE